MRIIKVLAEDVYFTSDMHLYHANILKFTNRNYATVDEMHADIIKKWNKKVPKNATVFILGDVSWKGLDQTAPFLDQLNGKKILINGNHDPKPIVTYFDEAYDMLGIQVVEKDCKTYCHLCHYPIADWYKKTHGALMLHGHCHGNMDDENAGNWQRMDVGMDSHDCTPLSWEDIKIICNRKYLKNGKKNE